MDLQPAFLPEVGISRVLDAFSKKTLTIFAPCRSVHSGRSIVVVRGREEEGVGAKIDLFSGEEKDSNLSVTDTRATMDKNDPFLNMRVTHGKKWVDKKWGKMQCGVRAYN